MDIYSDDDARNTRETVYLSPFHVVQTYGGAGGIRGFSKYAPALNPKRNQNKRRNVFFDVLFFGIAVKSYFLLAKQRNFK